MEGTEGNSCIIAEHCITETLQDWGGEEAAEYIIIPQPYISAKCKDGTTSKVTRA